MSWDLSIRSRLVSCLSVRRVFRRWSLGIRLIEGRLPPGSRVWRFCVVAARGAGFSKFSVNGVFEEKDGGRCEGREPNEGEDRHFATCLAGGRTLYGAIHRDRHQVENVNGAEDI